MSEGEYLETIAAMRKHYKVAASTADWLGLPIVIFSVGGQEEPGVLVTAGALGIEASGVYAALELLVEVDIEKRTYVLPSRDPTGFQGLGFVLKKLLGEEVGVGSPSDAVRLLADSGAEVLIDDDDVFLALVRGVGIAVGRNLSATDPVRHLERKLRERELLEPLDSTRIVVAPRLPAEGSGEAGRLVTAFVREVRVLTYDDLAEGVPESDFLRRFVDAHDLGLVIDLHESGAASFYALTSERPSSVEDTMLYIVLDQVRSKGYRVASVDELAQLNLSAAKEGVGYGRGVCGLIDYASSKAYAFAFVAPASLPAEARSDALKTASLSALNAFMVVSA